MKLSELNPNPENPRDIDQEEMAMLEKSLKQFGDLSGIVYNSRNKTLVGGHMRSKVFNDADVTVTEKYDEPNEHGTVAIGYVLVGDEKHKYREVDWDEPTHKAAMIAANQQGGNFNLPKLKNIVMELDALSLPLDLLGFKEDYLQTLIAPIHQGGMCDEDEVPEPPKESISKLGDLFKVGEHRLLCGDSTNIQHVERLMAGEKADMVFTDPPYNHAANEKLVSQSVRQAMKKLSESEWDKNFSFLDVAGSITSVLSENATVYICTSWHLAGEIWNWMKEHSNCSGYCVWHKTNPMPSLMKRHWTWSTELICYATYGKHVFNFPNSGHASNVWQVQKNRVNDLHPTMKPVEIPEIAINHSSNKDDKILDLFGGSGSTLIACEKTNRKCFMMELDPHYVDVIIKRFIQYANKPVFRINDDGIETDITAEFFI